MLAATDDSEPRTNHKGMTRRSHWGPRRMECVENLPNHYWFCNVDRYILNVGSSYRYQRNIIGDIEH